MFIFPYGKNSVGNRNKLYEAAEKRKTPSKTVQKCLFSGSLYGLLILYSFLRLLFRQKKFIIYTKNL